MSTNVTASGTSLTVRVAEEIRAWMGRRKMSQAELARQLNVSKMWVSYRLAGVQPIDLNDLQRIAGVLDVGVVDLLPRELVRPNAGSVRVAERPMPAPTRCAPDVRSPSIGGVHRRPKARQSATQPVAA